MSAEYAVRAMLLGMITETLHPGDRKGDAQSYMDTDSQGRFVSLMVSQSLFHALILAGK